MITYRHEDGRTIRKVRPSPKLEASPLWTRVDEQPQPAEPVAVPAWGAATTTASGTAEVASDDNDDGSDETEEGAD